MRKGFAPILIVIAITAVIILLFMFMVPQNITNKIRFSIFGPPKLPGETVDMSKVVYRTPTPTPTPTPTSNKNVVPLTSAWSKTKTYTNPKLDISFEYPEYFGINVIDIEKENKEWANTYKNDPNVKQPLYTSSFAARFSTPEFKSTTTGNDDYTYACNNTMRVSVAKYDNKEGLSLFDYIAKLNNTYPGDGMTQNFDTYKKNLTQTSIPKIGSYVFEGIIGENPVKQVYFTNNSNIYVLALSGGCDTGGEYTKDADKVFNKILSSIKYL